MEYIKILKKIRKCSDNDIFKGRHVLTNKLVALKEVKHNTKDEGIPANIIREISLLKELKHPNVLQLKNVFLKPMAVNLLFEYVYLDLKTYFQRVPHNFVFSQMVIQSYMHQITSGVAFCHQRRIFHRNLCPQNILITSKGAIKISDFNSGRTFEMTQKVYTPNPTNLSYRSPEVLLGTSQYTPKIDVWSIGCIFAEMFLRKPLFQSSSEIDQICRIFQVLGNSSKKLATIDKLPYYFSGLSLNTVNRLKSKITNAKSIEIYLMKQMLKINPVERISAKRILDHQYFLNFNANLRIPTIV